MKKVILSIFILLILSSCGVMNNTTGFDKLVSCNSCTVDVTRYVSYKTSGGNTWEGVFYECTINNSSCSCQKTGSSGTMKFDGDTITQPYDLPGFMNSCGL